MPDVAAVLVPIGGGGLAERRRGGDPGAGAGRAGDRRGAGAGGRRAGVARGGADRGVAGGAREPDDRRRHADAVDRAASTSRTCSTQLDAIVTVTEAEIAAAVRLAAEEARLVVEPSGALPVAAMRFHAAEAGLDRPSTGRSSAWSRAATWTRTAISSTSTRRSRPRADAGRGHRRAYRGALALAGLGGATRGELRLALADRGSLRLEAPVLAHGPPLLVAHPGEHQQDHRGQERERRRPAT